MQNDLSQWLTELRITWADNFTDLHYLDLSHGRLNNIPESIGQLINLQGLNLKNSKITSIPESIGQLTNLQTLDLSNNSLASIPESIGQLINLQTLDLSNNLLTSIPESLGQLVNLQTLNLASNSLTSIPESLGQLTNLQRLYLNTRQLTSIPESIGNLTKLQTLYLGENQLTSIPESIGKLINLQWFCIDSDKLTTLSPLQGLTQEGLDVEYFDTVLPRRYWTNFSDWQPEWLLDEDNTEIRRTLIQQIGYEKICDRLDLEAIDSWREYTLLKIDNIQAVYDDDREEPIYLEPLVMLKMTCPSTGHIHILRVPPEMTSAEAAITWVNHGIHPDNIAVQT